MEATGKAEPQPGVSEASGTAGKLPCGLWSKAITISNPIREKRYDIRKSIQVCCLDRSDRRLEY